MYFTNWHWLIGQSISHCMQLSRVPGSCEPSLRWALGVVHSQQLSSCTSLSAPATASNSLASSLPTSNEQTRKWHVTLTEAYFLHTPRQTPSSFGSTAGCEQIWQRLSTKKKKKKTGTVFMSCVRSSSWLRCDAVKQSLKYKDNCTNSALKTESDLYMIKNTLITYTPCI